MAILVGEKWLNKNQDHPLCKLWKRQDVEATNELFTLAYALDIMNKIDPNWVKHQINQIKSYASVKDYEILKSMLKDNIGKFCGVPINFNLDNMDIIIGD